MHSDKYFLCWYYEKPVFLTDSVMRRVMSCLPFAAMLRLCVGCWMFSAGDVLSASFDSLEGASQSAGGYNTNVISLANYMSFINSLRKQSYFPESLHFVYHRITRGNVFPLFVTLVVIVLVKLIRLFWKVLPFYWIGKAFAYVVRRCVKPADKTKVQKTKGFVHSYEILKRNDPLRTEAAPYTGSYYRYLASVGSETSTMGHLLSCLPSWLSCLCCVEGKEGKGRGDSEAARLHKQSIQEQLGEDWEETTVNDFPVIVKVPITLDHC